MITIARLGPWLTIKKDEKVSINVHDSSEFRGYCLLLPHLFHGLSDG